MNEIDRIKNHKSLTTILTEGRGSRGQGAFYAMALEMASVLEFKKTKDKDIV